MLSAIGRSNWANQFEDAAERSSPPPALNVTAATGRLAKNQIMRLNEARPDATFEVVAEFGPSESRGYVVQVVFDGLVSYSIAKIFVFII